MANWHTKETARAEWLDAETISDETLDVLLEVAKDQVIAYAPALPPYEPPAPSVVYLQDPEGDGLYTLPEGVIENPDGLYTLAASASTDPEQIPTRYAYGQLRQAQNLWNAGRVDSSGGVGDGGDFVIRPFPLDWHVKAILRPTRGRPRVR